MGRVIAWPRHMLHHSREHATADEADRCTVCRGGLSFCNICRGGEATLPTDCPGRAMTLAEDDDVGIGCLDYQRKSGWVWRHNIHGRWQVLGVNEC